MAHRDTNETTFAGQNSGAQVAQNYGTINVVTEQQLIEQLSRRIAHIGDAAHDSYENQRHRRCLEGTRTKLLRETTRWAFDGTGQYIYWLSGRAGTGKSTIALTLAHALDQPGPAVVSSFFFKRGGGDLAHSRKLISTLALQFSTRSVAFRSALSEYLNRDPFLGESASLSVQYEKLLVGPIRTAQHSSEETSTYIIILDALDECDDTNDVRLLLQTLNTTPDAWDLKLRVFITSRPETFIRQSFSQIDHIAYHELALHEIPRTVVDSDVKRYVMHRLESIRDERKLPADWPKETQVEAITRQADGLFIYAATVCRYINANRLISPVRRLDQLFHGSAELHGSTQALDEMYTFILEDAMGDDFSPEEAQEFGAYIRKVTGDLVLLLSPLSIEELARLLFLDWPEGKDTIQSILDSLSSIIPDPGDNTTAIPKPHQSFRDFLIVPTRCKDRRFQVDEKETHQDLFHCCLRLMEQFLQQNICGLPNRHCSVDDISNSSRAERLPEALRYACISWVGHIVYGSMSLDDNGAVHVFLQGYILYWLEVMSLLGLIEEGLSMMVVLARSISVRSHLSVRPMDLLIFIAGKSPSPAEVRR